MELGVLFNILFKKVFVGERFYLLILLFSLSFSAKARERVSVPVIDTAAITIVPTCSNEATGKVIVTRVKSRNGQVGYYLIKGSKLSSEHYPDKVLYANKVRHGMVKHGDSILMDHLEEGDYMLVVYSSEANSTGKSFFKQKIHIARHQPLSAGNYSVRNVSCSYASDGKITVETTGGNREKLEYAIIPNVGTVKQQGSKTVFSGLRPEVYDIYISDRCGKTVRFEQIKLRGVTPLSGVFDIQSGAHPDVDITLNVKMNSGEKLAYTLYNNSDIVKEGITENGAISIAGLNRGNYALMVVSADSVSCMQRWDTLFLLPVNTTFGDAQHRYYNVMEKRPVYHKPVKSQVTLHKGDCYIVIEKSKYVLNVYNTRDELLFTYPVVFGNKDLGDKMCEGDRKTPEGVFYISNKRTHDKWHKFLAIDYPNEESHRKFKERKACGQVSAASTIGGGIGLHGTWQGDDITIDRGENWTLGCISTKNRYIDELFEIIPAGTKVIIKR